MKDHPLFIYFGHHKCASTWTTNIVRQVCNKIGLKLSTVYVPEMFDKNLNAFIEKEGTNFLSYGNADVRYIDGIKSFKGFHIIRDPRDMVVSGYYSHLYSHTVRGHLRTEEHRKNLQKLSKAEGLFAEMDFCQQFFQDMAAWNYDQTDILEMRFEQLIQNPYTAMLNAFSHLDLVDERNCTLKKRMGLLGLEALKRILRKDQLVWPRRLGLRKIHAEDLLSIVYHNRFNKKANGREPGRENIKSHYRKGIAGDWVNHFNEEHKQYFKEKYNDILVKLGYENDADW